MDETEILSIIIAFLCFIVIYKYITTREVHFLKNDQLVSLVKKYFVVYALAAAGDWCQGSHIYALYISYLLLLRYESYGYRKAAIGFLFVIGYLSSPVVGLLADKYGRKKMCIFYGIIYGLGSSVKNINNYYVLIFGRVCTGIATSIYTTSFESWLISEFTKTQCPANYIQSIFEWSSFFNSIIAIFIGLLCTYVSNKWGYIAPFNMSIIIFITTTILIIYLWKENYGSRKSNSRTSCGLLFHTLYTLFHRKLLILLGTTQTLFESSMFIFVFFWTPTLESVSTNEISHGLIFTLEMMSLMIGSLIHEFLLPNYVLVNRFPYIFLFSSFSLFISYISQIYMIKLICYLFFEFAVGLYYPAIGTLRSKFITNDIRTTLMNIYRIGMNSIVIITLLNSDSVSTDTLSLISTVLLFLCTICAFYIRKCIKTEKMMNELGIEESPHS